ncbi:SDR family NAD(P)-dependent oxidoreductase [Athalassotoga saccharophila]|uniref:SDR family NAD(P)-dependent oxidoreductase n=1 Tax=Athalassotoga saccharophila TaxID=1441386 RepID=UPI00137A579B|nr:SDR family NAD(P)-dependent oxidoreductase [Athalassotoga saccharophila]BBJ28609.1 short chain dehydrogenase [Athalassotoga saccharophila]
MKNVVITGSTRGLGFFMGKEFLNAGCNVTFSGRGEKPNENLLSLMDQYKDQSLYVRCDVKNKADVENLWNESVKKWGSVDIWINNAGVNYPEDFIYNINSEYVESVIDTNIKGMIYGSQIASKNMLKQDKGQIWNMEGLGSNNMIVSKTILYGTSKHALTYFTRGLAKELSKTSVKVGRLSPGMMATDFILKQPESKGISESFKKIFNILGDKPEIVAKFFIPRILKNTKNDAHIMWLTTSKIIFRFATSPFVKRKII